MMSIINNLKAYMRNLAIQMMTEDLNQQQATRTNLMKSSHDALMAVINNLKS